MTPWRRPLGWDRLLGDPLRDDGPLGFRWAVRLDEREEFPTEATQLLNRLGASRCYVPRHLGGALGSFEELAWMLRAVARRDVTLAIGHGKTILGTQPVFLAGEPPLQEAVARRVLADEPVALALTEASTGSDLLATRTASSRLAPRRITGEKWLINNAARATALTTFVRTRPEGGPRGFSLLFVDKAEATGEYEVLPKIRTHGIRGADISGIRLENARCSSPPVGGEGGGLSTVLKTFAVTRTLIASVAVGAVDAALGIVLRFARARRLYGGDLLDIPHTRTVLTDALAELLACETASIAVARMLHAAPDQAMFWSSVVKYYVPVCAERLIRDLALVFGARHYLREGDGSGMFQKIQRDAAILSVFDGHTLVNLTNVLLHAKALARGTRDGQSLDSATHLVESIPDFDSGRLTIWSPNVCGAEELARRSRTRFEAHDYADSICPLLDELTERATSVRERMELAVPRNAFDVTDELVQSASEYARLAVAALAASVHAHGGDRPSGPMTPGDWLLLVLTRSIKPGGAPSSLLERCRDRTLTFLLQAAETGEPISFYSGRTDLEVKE